MIYHLEQTTSTSDDAKNKKYLHGDVIWAERQSAGRGQRGHSWSSTQGLNLTFSLVLEPHFLPVGEQFLLSEVVALALVDTYEQEGIQAKIKWTNDIYIGDKKGVGILIEHHYSGGTLARTVAGIGINVNQTVFDPLLPNPTSMALAANRQFDREKLLDRFLSNFKRRYAQLEGGEKQLIQEHYQERMYALGVMREFRLPDGSPIIGAIQGVRPSGELIIRHDDGQMREYLFREIEFVLKK